MQLGQIVLKLRQANTIFGNLIGGTVELAIALTNTLTKDMTFVIPLSDIASSNKLDSGINQTITESFGIVVALRNDNTQSDKLGIIAYDKLDNIRSQFFKALLGWQMTGMESLVTYDSGKLMDINSAYLWYQFKFKVSFRIDDDDGVDMDELYEFDTLYSQWVLSPDAELPIKEYLPVTGFTPDMEHSLDLTEDPNAGEFGKGFNVIFDTYTV